MSEISEETKDLVSKAARGDQRVSAEDLVANELATAILSKPMDKIRHTYEALMLLGEEERQSAGITEEEQEEGKKIYELCQTLQNAFIDKFTNRYNEVIERSATIPWPFEQEKASDRLDWMEHVTWKLYGARDEHKETYEKGEELAKEGKMKESLYFTSSNRITVDTLNRIKTQFINYAMPRATKILKKIIKVVSSSSFQAAMDRLKGGVSSGS